ncbi:MAG: transposase [Chloroflexaceae bacterium]|jgi:transposase|nr:transposase [Chloroflexaceae bacterium]
MIASAKLPEKRLIAMKNRLSASLTPNPQRRPKLGANAVSTGEKKIHGRKRQFWVDTNGFLLRVLVHPAHISDTEGAEWLLTEHHQDFPRMQEVRVDEGYKAGLAAWMEAHTAFKLNVIAKIPGTKGFAVIPKRWVVERSIAWTGRNRLASREYNRNQDVSEAFIYLGSITMLLNRLHPRK